VEGLPRGARRATVKKHWEKNEIDSKWKETNWFKRRQQMQRRKELTDFDRFKVMRLKKQRRFEERKALAKIKAS
jgi:large subunit ribosomal protein L14e